MEQTEHKCHAGDQENGRNVESPGEEHGEKTKDGEENPEEHYLVSLIELIVLGVPATGDSVSAARLLRPGEHIARHRG